MEKYEIFHIRSRYHGGRQLQFSQSNRHSTIGTWQTEYHEALPSSANMQSHLTLLFTDNGNASWYSACQVPMVEWWLDCENCCHLTVVGLHDTGTRCQILRCVHCFRMSNTTIVQVPLKINQEKLKNDNPLDSHVAQMDPDGHWSTELQCVCKANGSQENKHELQSMCWTESKTPPLVCFVHIKKGALLFSTARHGFDHQGHIQVSDWSLQQTEPVKRWEKHEDYTEKSDNKTGT